ncbi:MAG: GerAB/ArcD/ProY family transporter [Clostridia bacterium]|nr:GerAB/ArcD/ProY family transporter [Clostridia bacterium]
MTKSKIGTMEAIMLVLTIIITHTISSLPREILVFTKSATILNLIFVSILAILFSYLIVRLMKNFGGCDIIDISEYLGGKVLKNIVGIIFILYFLISSSILLRNFCESIKIIYYPMTNILFIIALFILATCTANRLDFNASLKTNLLIVPLVLASIVFLFFANMNKFVPERAFPIFGDGLFNTFVLGLGNLAAFGGISFLYFLPPYLKKPEKMKKIALLSIAISAIYLILCVATLLFMFPFVMNSNEITPLYNATRYIEFGSFFQRLESIFLLIWILAYACYLSITSKFAMNILKKLTNIENKKPLIDIFGLLIFAIALVPKNYALSDKFETEIYPYLVIGITFILSFSILLLANLMKKKVKKLNLNSQ